MRRWLIAALFGLAALPALAADTPAPLDLETVMADPDWIGQAVESPYWSVDGTALYYDLKRDGSPVRDRFRVDPASGVSVKLDAAARATADGPAVYDRAHARAAFIRHGDVFVVDLASGTQRQITRSPQAMDGVRFGSDGHSLQFRSGNDWYVADLASGTFGLAARVQLDDDPAAAKPDALGTRQLELFSTLRAAKAEREAWQAEQKALAAADPGRSPEPFHLGGGIDIAGSELSPDGRWLLLVVQPKGYPAGRVPTLTRYVTESGYSEAENVRTYVGRNDPAPQSLLLLDLVHHTSQPIALDTLPGIHDDPLAALRKQAIARATAAGDTAAAQALAAPAVRPVRIGGEGRGLAWSEDGRRLAIQLRAIDNKDRWIASVDFAHHALVPEHRLTDPAWINWNFNDFGWLKDGSTLWYLSEESGWSQLYLKPAGGKARALTRGHFEVSAPELSPDGQWFYLRANREAPWSYDVYRVPVAGGELARVTRYQGLDGFALAPDGTRLAVLHSAPYVLPQLAVMQADGSAPRELTHSMKPAFSHRAWIAPEIVEVPSTHGAGHIAAKYYGPAQDDGAARPAVIFVHGAGYLQNVTLGWSNYFREQMFHNLLVQKGYVVLDMDYRASEGYGRDWRTAIYRNMGHPELEDLLDGKRWLVANRHVDPARVGIYGGSYGGFMTEMALLRAPGEFAAGAALRPVGDWTLYNHEYTSNILNDPQLDPEAYRTSSPITYAEHLADPLLIQHGLIDNNVLAEDSIRLYQRFIELHKKNFWISLYPLERHGFVHPDSWHDEYRRVEELFDTWVKHRPE